MTQGLRRTLLLSGPWGCKTKPKDVKTGSYRYWEGEQTARCGQTPPQRVERPGPILTHWSQGDHQLSSENDGSRVRGGKQQSCPPGRTLPHLHDSPRHVIHVNSKEHGVGKFLDLTSGPWLLMTEAGLY